MGFVVDGKRNDLIRNLITVRAQLTQLQSSITALISSYQSLISVVNASVTANDGTFTSTDLTDLQNVASADKTALKNFVAGL